MKWLKILQSLLSSIIIIGAVFYVLDFDFNKLFDNIGLLLILIVFGAVVNYILWYKMFFKLYNKLYKFFKEKN